MDNEQMDLFEQQSNAYYWSAATTTLTDSVDESTQTNLIAALIQGYHHQIPWKQPYTVTCTTCQARGTGHIPSKKAC